LIAHQLITKSKQIIEKHVCKMSTDLQPENDVTLRNSFDWMILYDEMDCDELDTMDCDWLVLYGEMGCDWVGV
jgi:hypothetical protein